MQFELTASMMCANYGNLAQEVKALEEGGIDSFHIDIMDGRYVPNFAMSLNDMRYIAGAATKPLDVHLMIEHPNNHINLFLKNLRKGDTVYIHPEAEYHPSTTLQTIIDAGMVPGIAINPGNAGQMYLPYVGKKITKLLALKEDMDFEMYWDGACSAERILEFAPKGMKGFVLGTTLLFGKDRPYGEILRDIRDLRL